jgi:carboxyl-terminal processing protease
LRKKLYAVALAVVISLVVCTPQLRAQAPIDQTDGLAGLCQVWGLLKYFHPSVANRTDWDSVLVSAVPRFLAASSRKAFNQTIVDLIGSAGLGYVFRELSVGLPRESAGLGSAFRWIDDPAFEPATRVLLKAIVLAHRPGSNRYVSDAGAGNPDFRNDQSSWEADPYPREEVRLLALFRYWNMVQYYFPCKDAMDRDWPDLLTELIPRFRRAANATEYNVAAAGMTSAINDAHASTSSAVLSSYWGMNSAPIRVRLVEDRTVITRVYSRLLTPGADLRPGDIVTHINSVPVEMMRATMRPLVNASNEASLERNIHGYLVRTSATSLSLRIQRGASETLVVTVDCPSVGAVSVEASVPTASVSAILPGNIGYVHMGLLGVSDVASVMAQLKNTRGIVFDIRNYPNGTLYAVSNYLNPATKPFVKFLEPDYDHPGSFVWTSLLVTGPGSPNAWSGAPPATFTYAGRVVILCDQETQSQAEYTVMAFQTAPDSTVIGSQTAGADGNVSLISLPGGIYTYFSGLGVFYPDGRPAKRVGIAPDIVSKPTVQGVREGRDEVLERAIQYLR